MSTNSDFVVLEIRADAVKGRFDWIGADPRSQDLRARVMQIVRFADYVVLVKPDGEQVVMKSRLRQGDTPSESCTTLRLVNGCTRIESEPAQLTGRAALIADAMRKELAK